VQHCCEMRAREKRKGIQLSKHVPPYEKVVHVPPYEKVVLPTG
jgi:hypothetical protein